MQKIYLCAPYSSDDPYIIDERFDKVNRKAAELMDAGHIVFSPISHSHPISFYTQADALNHDFWLTQDLSFIDWCDEVWVLKLDGWDKSKGIQREIEFATNIFKVVKFLEE